MVERSSKRVAVSGAEPASLSSQSYGQGPAFVWGHSLLGSIEQENQVGVFGWPDLADRFQMIRYDARGHGESEVTDDPSDYGWDKLAQNMWEVADAYTGGQVILGGASMGSATAIYAAQQHPDRVKAMVLAIPPTAWEERPRQIKLYSFLAKMVSLVGKAPMWISRLMPAPRRRMGFRAVLESTTFRLLTNADANGIIAAARGACLTDLPSRESLKKLTMPVLILAWPGDPAHPVSIAQQLAELLPNAQLQVADHPQDPYQWPDLVREYLLGV